MNFTGLTEQEIFDAGYGMGRDASNQMTDSVVAAAPAMYEALHKIANCSKYQTIEDLQFAMNDLRNIANEALQQARGERK